MRPTRPRSVTLVLCLLLGLFPTLARAEAPPLPPPRDRLLLDLGGGCTFVAPACTFLSDLSLAAGLDLQAAADPRAGVGGRLGLELALFQTVSLGAAVHLALGLGGPGATYGIAGPAEYFVRLRVGPRYNVLRNPGDRPRLSGLLSLSTLVLDRRLAGDPLAGAGCLRGDAEASCVAAWSLRGHLDYSLPRFRLLLSASAGFGAAYDEALPGRGLLVLEGRAGASVRILQEASLWAFAEAVARVPLPEGAALPASELPLLGAAGLQLVSPTTEGKLRLAVFAARGLGMPGFGAVLSLGVPITGRGLARWVPVWKSPEQVADELWGDLLMELQGFVDPQVGADGCLYEGTLRLGVCGQPVPGQAGVFRFSGGVAQAGESLWLKGGVLYSKAGGLHPVMQAPLAGRDAVDKLRWALVKGVYQLPRQLQEQVKTMLSPEALRALGAGLGAYAGAHAIGAGEVADVALAVGGLVLLGKDALVVAADLERYVTLATAAQFEPELDEAARHLAHAVTVAGVDAVLALLARQAGRREGRVETVAERGGPPRGIGQPGPGGGARPGEPAVHVEPPATTRVTGAALEAARREFNRLKPSHWKLEAQLHPERYTPAQREAMASGRAPMGADGHPMEIHHKVPLAEGGSNYFDNMAFLTQTEHRRGGNYKLNHPGLP